MTAQTGMQCIKKNKSRGRFRHPPPGDSATPSPGGIARPIPDSKTDNKLTTDIIDIARKFF